MRAPGEPLARAARRKRGAAAIRVGLRRELAATPAPEAARIAGDLRAPEALRAPAAIRRAAGEAIPVVPPVLPMTRAPEATTAAPVPVGAAQEEAAAAQEEERPA